MLSRCGCGAQASAQGLRAERAGRVAPSLGRAARMLAAQRPPPLALARHCCAGRPTADESRARACAAAASWGRAAGLRAHMAGQRGRRAKGGGRRADGELNPSWAEFRRPPAGPGRLSPAQASPALLGSELAESRRTTTIRRLAAPPRTTGAHSRRGKAALFRASGEQAAWWPPPSVGERRAPRTQPAHRRLLLAKLI